MTANDNELLRQYVREQSEAAFTELVRRHLPLVYAAALRQVNGVQTAAEDVAQAVFTDLARKAPRLLRHTSLTGWLYTSTRFQAAKSRRSAHRRVIREQAAHAMNEILRDDNVHHTTEEDWAVLQPLLDDAMNELNPSDREAVLWRYFEERPIAEIGRRLGLKENAARMRVERALDKLRSALARRGITSSVAALATALAAHAMEQPTSGLAEKVARSSLAAGGGQAWWLVSTQAKLALGVASSLTLGVILFSSHPKPLSVSTDSAALDPTAASPDTQTTVAPQTANTAPATTPAAAASPAAKQFELRLSLVSAENSQPVVDGQVSFSLETASNLDIREVHPDASGMVRIQIPSDTVGLRLVTEIEGLADTRLAWRRDRGEIIPAEYQLKLTPGVNLGGSVVNSQGQPLNGAHVEAYLEEPTTSPRPECHVAGFDIKTDEQGRWQVARVAPELIRGLTLSASHPELATEVWLRVGVEVDAEAQLRAGSYKFVLGAATNLSGVVVDPEGYPVSGATVRIGGLYEVSTRTAETGADGKFHFSGCKAGKLFLTGEAKGFAATTIQADAGANTDPIRLVLSRGLPLRVRVLDHDGNPLPHAEVDITPDLNVHWADGSLRPQAFNARHKTDENGLANFPALPEYDLWVGVTLRGYICQSGIKTRATGQQLAVNLLTNLVVSGTVRDATTGKPVPKFRIVTGGLEEQGPYFSDMDRFVLNFAGGEFRHAYDEAVMMGENKGYLLRFEADGYAPQVSRLIAPEEGSAQLAVSLQPVSIRKLTVLNPDGTAAAWTDFGLLDRMKRNCLGLKPGGLEHYQGSDGALQQTDAQGVIQLPAGGDIHHVVAANESGYLVTNLDELADPTSLQLQPWGRIEGSLPPDAGTNADTEVWINFVVNPQNALMTGMSFHVKPDAAGHFIMSRVPPARLMILLGKKTAVTQTQWEWSSTKTVLVDVDAGETTHVTFDSSEHAASR